MDNRPRLAPGVIVVVFLGALAALAAVACTVPPAPAVASPAVEAAPPPVARVSGAEARALVAQGAQLVDVRTPEEFAAGHVDGAVNMPLQALAGGQDLATLGDKSGAVVVYCHSGRRSREAAKLLAGAGFTAVKDLGPMSAW